MQQSNKTKRLKEINRSVVGISDNAEQSLVDADENQKVSEELLNLARSLDEQVRSFKLKQ